MKKTAKKKSSTKKLTEREIEVINEAIPDNNEFDSTMLFGDAFDTGPARIENEEFHKLKKKFVDARDKLTAFLHKNGFEKY